MNSRVCLLINQLYYGKFKDILQMICLCDLWFFLGIVFIYFFHTIAKGLAMCWLERMITTQKEHILGNNSHEIHLFWVIIMSKIPN